LTDSYKEKATRIYWS